MKNPKILYILIGAFCVIAVIAGVYTQFFVKGEKQSELILPHTQNVEETPIETEKTQEELKQELTALFTNKLEETEEEDLTEVIKLNKEKAIVYAAYENQSQTGSYEVDIHLPVINIAGEVVAGFNEITQKVFANKASEVLKNTNSYKTIYSVNYVGYVTGDILSVAIKSTLKEGNNPQRVIVQTYNYNLYTGQRVSFLGALTEAGINKKNAQNKIEKTIKTAADEANILAQSGYSIYTRNLNDEMYQVQNVNNFLMKPDGKLYTIFAYGNQNFTSEMDVVQF